MGGRKTTEKNGPSEAEFTVVLEDLRSQFGVFGEALQGFREEVKREFSEFRQSVDTRFAQVDGRLDKVDGRLDKIEGRLDRVDGRLDKIDGRLDKVDREGGLVKAAVLQNGRDLRELRAEVAQKVDRDEVESLVRRTIAQNG